MIILIGPSASGKTEIAQILEKNYNLKKVITHTTREKRINEKENVDYYFVSKETFLDMIKQNKLVEYTFYNNNYYGTSKKEISDNKCVVLDPNGAKAFFNLHDKRIFIVNLMCSEEIRKNRMYSRLDKEESIFQRLNSDKETFTEDKLSFANINICSEIKSPSLLTSVLLIFKNLIIAARATNSLATKNKKFSLFLFLT